MCLRLILYWHWILTCKTKSELKWCCENLISAGNFWLRGQQLMFGSIKNRFTPPLPIIPCTQCVPVLTSNHRSCGEPVQTSIYILCREQKALQTKWGKVGKWENSLRSNFSPQLVLNQFASLATVGRSRGRGVLPSAILMIVIRTRVCCFARPAAEAAYYQRRWITGAVTHSLSPTTHNAACNPTL